MGLANVAYLPALTWQNPQLTALEVQALMPIFGEHPVEMGLAGRERPLFERLQAEPVYRRLLRAGLSRGGKARRHGAVLAVHGHQRAGGVPAHAC